MGKHMSIKAQALCYTLRNPPAHWKVKKEPFSKIPAIIRKELGERITKGNALKSVQRFSAKPAGSRGRKAGWRKTTSAEDTAILQTFQRVRQPLGSAVDSRDVHSALPDALRRKVTPRTVRNRLAERGFSMQDKKAGDDHGDEWRRRRLAFCDRYRHKTENQIVQLVQGVGDFRLFTYHPRRLKKRAKVKTCVRTIMSKAERKKSAFQKPRHHPLTRKEYKTTRRAKVFGLTLSTGASLVVPCPTNCTAENWIQIVHGRLADVLRNAFPDRRSFTILLDGETILHTDDAVAALAEYNIRLLPDWPPNSPDLNPQENVWAWAETRLRKVEKSADTFSVFKRRIVAASKAYPSGHKLVRSLPGRMQTCHRLRGANIGK